MFVGGLHRSGTTLLGRCMSEHPQVSGFSGTGATEDEGQHLQTVYRAANEHGGPGRFGFDPAAHLTEDSPLVSDESRRLLLEREGRAVDRVGPEPDPDAVPAGALPQLAHGRPDPPPHRSGRCDAPVRARPADVEADVLHLVDRALAALP